MNKLAPLCVGLASLFLFGCALPRPAAPVDGEEFGIRRQREWDQLKRLKNDLRWTYDEPVTFFFPDDGEVTVRSWALEGGPGWEYVRAEFLYENTTDKFMERVDIELHVLDETGAVVTSSRVGLWHPWGRPLSPGTCFSDEIRVPTGGAHLNREGWHWTIECRGRVETY